LQIVRYYGGSMGLCNKDESELLTRTHSPTLGSKTAKIYNKCKKNYHFKTYCNNDVMTVH